MRSTRKGSFAGGDGSSGGGGSGGAPGRRTLTSALPVRSGSGGEPLPEPIAGSFSAGLGADLSGVRVHTDDGAADAAASLSARAFTQGNDIYFARGAYAPETSSGKHLLAHEVAHTVQQSGGSPVTQHKLDVSMPGDSLEHEADRAADALVRGAPAPALSKGGGIARKAEAEWVLPTSADRDHSWLPSAPTAKEWLALWTPRLVIDLRFWLEETQFTLTNPYVRWKGGARDFVTLLWEPIHALGSKEAQQAALTRLVTPDSIDSLVDVGRDVKAFRPSPTPVGQLTRGDSIAPPPDSRGTYTWEPAVVGEVGKILARRVIESLARVTPHCLHAKNQRALAENVPDKGGGPDFKREDVPAAHPIDPYVAGALAKVLDYDLHAYREANPWEKLPAARKLGELRKVKIEWQHGSGDWNWLRAIDPPDATKEDVAFTLYGDSTWAHTLTAAAPLFGFVHVDEMVGPVADDYWKQAAKSPKPPSAGRMGPRTTDFGAKAMTPEDQLLLGSGALLDEVALNQARAVARSRVQVNADGRLAIVERMRGAIRLLDQIKEQEGLLGYGGGRPGGGKGLSEGPRKRLEERSKRMADEATPVTEVIKWDGQTQEQLHLLNAALNGVKQGAIQAEGFKGTDVAEDAREIGLLYLQAAAMSDLPESAHEKLIYADQESLLFPIKAIEKILAGVRKVMNAQASTDSPNPVISNEAHAAGRDIRLHEIREEKLRAGLAKIRAKVMQKQDPEGVRAEIRALSQELSELQAEVSMVADMDMMDAAMSALLDDLSKVGKVTGTNKKDLAKYDVVAKLRSEWFSIYHLYKAGRKQEAKEALDKKRPELKGLLNDVRELIEDNATLNKWVTFAAMVVIAVATAGIGAYVEAAAGAVWGAASFATFAVTTGAEAVVFTSLSYALTEKDPSIGGFLKELGKNVLLFGALKWTSNKYLSWMGEETAATLSGKAEMLLVQFVSLNTAALVEAQIKMRLDKGRDLTPEEIIDISKETALFLAATSMASFAAKPGIERLKLRGHVDGSLYRYKAIKVELVEVGARIQESKGRGDFEAQSRDLLAKQRQLLEAEDAALAQLELIARDPKKAAKAGLDKADSQALLLELRQQHNDLAASMKPIRVLANTEGTGAVRFIEAGAKFKEAVELYSTQEGTEVRHLVTDPLTGAKGIEVKKGGEKFDLIERMSAVEGVIAQAPKAGRPSPSAAEVELRREAMRLVREAVDARMAELKRQIDADPNPSFERIQVGGDVAGLMNQASLGKHNGGGQGPAGDRPKTLTISDAPEVWRERGPVNQTAGELEGPGLRTGDHTADQHTYVDAPVLADAILRGRAESGMSTYAGHAVGAIETYSGQTDWASTSRRHRIKIRVPGQPDRYFYADAIDIAVGPGPSAGLPEAVVKGGHKGADYKEMIDDGRVIYGDQAPTRVNPGTDVMVLGGSGNGAAMAEFFAKLGRVVKWVSRVSEKDAPLTIKPELDAIQAELNSGHASSDRVEQLLGRRKELLAFGKAMLPRNIEEAFESPLAKEKITRLIDDVKSIEPIEEGGKKRVKVTLKNGGEVIVDQVIVSYGQNPDAPGAAGALIANHQMVMILDAEGRLVGLQSRDGSIRLIGSAFADPKLATHVVPEQQAEFKRKVAEDAARLPPNSRGVGPSVANAAITIQHANEVLATQTYRLPGEHTSIELRPGDEARWPEQVAVFLAGEMGIEPARFSVEMIKDGKSGDPVFRVRVGVEELGYFKVFKSAKESANEIKMLGLVAAKKLEHFQVVREKGTMSVTGEPGKTKGAMLMESAQGSSVDSMIKNMPTDAALRPTAFAHLREAVVKVARGLAEFHKAFKTGKLMTTDQKMVDIKYIQGRFEKILPSLDPVTHARIKAALQSKVVDAYLAADVPATAYHGDANTGNFIIGPDGKLKVIDIGSMQYSRDADGKFQSTGGADVGRFLESLESRRPGALTPDEVRTLTELFQKTYFGETRGWVNQGDLSAAMKLYQVELEVVLIMAADPKKAPDSIMGPLGRLHSLVGLEPPAGSKTPYPGPTARDDEDEKKKKKAVAP